MSQNFENKIDSKIYRELEEALKDFIQRIELVKKAILDLGIKVDELQRLGPTAWVQNGIPQTGIWKNDRDWQYFLHGKGCRLTNVVSGEILDWDSDNESGVDIDPYAFIRYLKWRIDKDNHFQNIKLYAIKKDLKSLISLVQHILKSNLIV